MPHVYPTDCIGNPLRKGDLVVLKLDSPFVMAQVAEVEPGGGLTDTQGAMLLNGSILVTVPFPLQFSPDHPAIQILYAMRKPADNGPGLVTQ